MSAEVDHSPIVVGVDGSVGSRAAVGWAIDEATRRGAPVELVHSWRPMYRATHNAAGDSEAEMVARDHGAWLLAAAAGSVTSSAPQLVVTTRLIKGRPSAGLLEAAANAQLLVVGARGVGGYAGLSLGSVSLHVVAHSPSSVVVVRSAREVGPVIVGIDGSAESKNVLRAALEEANLRHSPLVVMSALFVHSRAEGVLDRERAFAAAQANANYSLEELLGILSTEYGTVEVSQSLPIGYPAEVLANASMSAQLLIVGSHGGGGFSGMKLGSIAHAVVHNAHCTVMVVRDRPNVH
ncbi:MAG TPA: universal stress protein [Acidothermaceae bacterium]|nr:universal stress protein [Acidothermaceae bacterium]